MGRNTATINYAIGSLGGNTFNMYLCGSALLTLPALIFGLIETGTIGGAFQAAFDYFIMKFTPFPIDELLVAGGPEEFVMNIIFALGVGLAFSSIRYWMNPGYGRGF